MRLFVMRLFVMRHGEAEMVAVDDASRRLTAHGEAQVIAAAAALREHDAVPARLYASPFVRAAQTAAIVARELGINVTDTWDELEPESDPRDVLARIDSTGETGQIMIVSHQPLVGRILQLHAGENISMSTAKVVAVDANDWQPGGGTILWSVVP